MEVENNVNQTALCFTCSFLFQKLLIKATSPRRKKPFACSRSVWAEGLQQGWAEGWAELKLSPCCAL